jgi:hypothetical protein
LAMGQSGHGGTSGKDASMVRRFGHPVNVPESAAMAVRRRKVNPG